MEGVSPRRRTVSMGASLDEPPSLKSDNIVLRQVTIQFCFFAENLGNLYY